MPLTRKVLNSSKFKSLRGIVHIKKGLKYLFSNKKLDELYIRIVPKEMKILQYFDIIF